MTACPLSLMPQIEMDDAPWMTTGVNTYAAATISACMTSPVLRTRTLRPQHQGPQGERTSHERETRSRSKAATVPGSSPCLASCGGQVDDASKPLTGMTRESTI